MLESGFRISDLNNIPVNGKECALRGKIALDNTFLLSYSHSVYGINYNKQNYKISLNTLRDDLKGYIGIESIVAPWSEQMKLWHGSWDSTDKNKSYVYEWKESEYNHPNYTPDKFDDLENSYYIIKDAPFPYETADLNNRDKGEIKAETHSEGVAPTTDISINKSIAAADPAPDSNKIVTKKYVDERLASKRIVEVEPAFAIRNYDCNYVIRGGRLKNVSEIIITFPDNFNSHALHNNLKFTLFVEGIWNEAIEKWLPPVPKETVSWKLRDAAGNDIKLIWVNDGENKATDIGDEYLYSNARYLIFNFETITHNIATEAVKEDTEAGEITTSFKQIANFEVFAACENLLYRNSGIERVNDKEVNFVNITGDGININTIQEGSTANIILEPDLTFTSANTDVLTIEKKSDKEWQFSTPDLVSTNSRTLAINKESKDAWRLTVPDLISTDDNTLIINKEISDTWKLTVPNQKIKLELKKGEKLLSLNASDNIYTLGTNEIEEDYSKFDEKLETPEFNYSITCEPDNLDSFKTYTLIWNPETKEEFGNENASIYLILNKLNDRSEYLHTVKLLFMSFEDTPLDIIINKASECPVYWAMTDDGSSPIFKANRLYHITLNIIDKIWEHTLYDNMGDIDNSGSKICFEKQIIAHIDWWRNK